MKTIILTSAGFVAGFCTEHEIVQVANSSETSKHFPTRKDAEAFVNAYANAGYGLRSIDVGFCTIVEPGDQFECLLQVKGGKFRCTGITDDPARNFDAGSPVLFRSLNNGEVHLFKLTDLGFLVEVAEAYGHLCGSWAVYYATEDLAKQAKAKDGGRLVGRGFQLFEDIKTSIA